MYSNTWWNQATLPCPATAAQKIDVSHQPIIKGMIESLLSEISKSKTSINEVLTILDSEAVLFRRFLYKLHAVFVHDKGYKTLKQIQKSLVKFKQLDFLEIVAHFQEQHCFSLTSKRYTHVAPKPVYEYFLIRIQGSARLLSQILCYCHAFGLVILQKVDRAHFININIISMSFVARIWALCLQMVHILIRLHEQLSNAFESKDVLPASDVKFLPPGVTTVKNLRAWLINDETLTDIQAILMPMEKKSSESRRTEIWSSIATKNDDEKRHIEELKFLVETNREIAQTELMEIKDNTINSRNEFDIGILVSRESSLPTNNKGKRNRSKKRKRNQMEN